MWQKKFDWVPPLISQIIFHYIRASFTFVFAFFFALTLTQTIIDIHLKDNDSFETKATNFSPGLIGDLCLSDSGAEKRITFIDTSGEECLNPRQACAIESAALTNPEMTVYVYMSLKLPSVNQGTDNEPKRRYCGTMEILSKLPNVQIIHEDLKQRLIGTPLASFVNNPVFQSSNYSKQHLSDALRIALLNEFGGIYLDTNVIVLRSLRCFENSIGQMRDSNSAVANGVLIFNQSHKFLNFYMRLMKQIYDPLVKEALGSSALLKAIRLFCDVSEEYFDGSLGDFLVCHEHWNITLLYTDAFFHIELIDRPIMFQPNFPLSHLDKLQTSYLVQVHDDDGIVEVPPSSLYAFLAQRFCPVIYSGHTSHLYPF